MLRCSEKAVPLQIVMLHSGFTLGHVGALCTVWSAVGAVLLLLRDHLVLHVAVVLSWQGYHG